MNERLRRLWGFLCRSGSPEPTLTAGRWFCPSAIPGPWSAGQPARSIPAREAGRAERFQRVEPLLGEASEAVERCGGVAAGDGPDAAGLVDEEVERDVRGGRAERPARLGGGEVDGQARPRPLHDRADAVGVIG